MCEYSGTLGGDNSNSMQQQEGEAQPLDPDLMAMKRTLDFVAAFPHVSAEDAKVLRMEDAVRQFREQYTSRDEAGRDAVLKEVLAGNSTEASWKVFAQRVMQHDPEGLGFCLELRSDISRRRSLLGDAQKWIDGALLDIVGPQLSMASTYVDRVSLESSGVLLDYVVRNEQVHGYRTLDNLRTRFGPNRRCFGLFHAAVGPNKPLAFVHVALMPDISSSMDAISAQSQAQAHASPQAAIFYSISNAEPGASKSRLGYTLLMQAIPLLQAEVPSLREFSTLSPIPYFCYWMQRAPERLLASCCSPEQLERIKEALGSDLNKVKHSGGADLVRGVVQMDHWARNEELVEAMREPLMEIAKHYILHERQSSGRPRCPVANFHLGNGAFALRLNWMADKSRKGLNNSAGIMINYKYDVELLAGNRHAFLSKNNITSLL